MSFAKVCDNPPIWLQKDKIITVEQLDNGEFEISCFDDKYVTTALSSDELAKRLELPDAVSVPQTGG